LTSVGIRHTAKSLNQRTLNIERERERERERDLMHVPQRSMPESFVCPSCPKLHAHLKQAVMPKALLNSLEIGDKIN